MAAAEEVLIEQARDLAVAAGMTHLERRMAEGGLLKKTVGDNGEA